MIEASIAQDRPRQVAIDLTRDGRRMRGRAGSSAGGQATRKGAMDCGMVVVLDAFVCD